VTPDESLTWLDSTQLFGVKLGLENTRLLLEGLGNPHVGRCFIHVAGSNGKGSVCAMLDAILRADGRRCGLYTSPHLINFRERIRVDGRMISPDALAASLTRIRNVSRGWAHCPTFFEIATVAALDHFHREGCDIVILETGMGGRLDATNVVTPRVSVITPIARDHTEWLGASLADIAAEKAGIIKPGVPVVSAMQHPEAADVIASRAKECGSPLIIANIPYPGRIALSGAHQNENAAVAIASLRAAALTISESTITQGMENVSWPARFQRIGERFLIDGAHNPHAARALVATWQEVFGKRKTTIIFGAMRDKDFAEMLSLLAPIAREFFFVPVSNPRSAAPGDLHTITPSQAFPSLQEAMQSIRRSDAPCLVTGSLFLAGEALALLGSD
jgi:dihydrofolate synthase/folylpolyglutamate synthase